MKGELECRKCPPAPALNAARHLPRTSVSASAAERWLMCFLAFQAPCQGRLGRMRRRSRHLCHWQMRSRRHRHYSGEASPRHQFLARLRFHRPRRSPVRLHFHSRCILLHFLPVRPHHTLPFQDHSRCRASSRFHSRLRLHQYTECKHPRHRLKWQVRRRRAAPSRDTPRNRQASTRHPPRLRSHLPRLGQFLTGFRVHRLCIKLAKRPRVLCAVMAYVCC